jgi:hypothetical protein
MAGTMSEADLVADLKASLQDAASVFTAASDADFKRHLAAAALDFARPRPRTVLGSLTLTADEAAYALPNDFHAFKCDLWGLAPKARPQPWEKGWPGPLPRAAVAESGGAKKLTLAPPPTAAQISVLGAEYRFYYYAKHAIGADAANTTIAAGDRGLLLLRAQAEAMRELAMRNIHKPVQLRDGLTGTPRNALPSHLYEKFIEEFERAWN